ncbi:hypothetical protein EV667_3490 [Ancylobacter aquaticus]|uniref:DUF2946 domain-containing protein n=1 Tax=Ancylobacter aquaticus TaxID=100 RepID=A0A4R1HQU6_ANCAQ|nr:hypothetical protein EV667_3490 [Ancylobacter aquaticus]
MAGVSRRYGLGVGALALALAYALVLQLLLASVFAGRAAGDPLSPSVHAICLSGAASTFPGTDDGGGAHVPHCPLCTLRLNAILPPLIEAGEAMVRPALPAVWAPDIRAPRPVSFARSAHHPRGPPRALSIV